MRSLAGLLLGLVASIVACSSASEGSDAIEPGAGNTKDGGAPSPGDNGNLCTGADCNAPEPNATTDDEGSCPANSQLIYVATNTVTQIGIGQTNSGPPITLWSYWPPTNEFKKIGDPSCLSQEAVMNMTVDRNGFAWILGNSQKIYKVDTKDASCVGSVELKDGLYYPSIAFVGTTVKSLYVFAAENADGDLPASHLATLDTATSAFADVGVPQVGGPGSWGTMTANGNGNVFYLEKGVNGIGTAGKQKLYEMDPKAAKVLSSFDVNTSMWKSGGQTGLAYFGTQFYLFFDKAVYRFDPSTKAATQVGTPSWSGVGVAGAGQSTCVPNTAVAPGTEAPVVH